METAEIEAFLVLAEELHFGHAAERLRVTQPRVSRLIAALERRIGGALFERTSRQVRLTPLGGQFRAQLQPGWAQVIAALDNARAASRGVTGVLRVGLTITIPSEPLTRLVAAFEDRHRECLVILVEHQAIGDDWDIWRPLRNAESDVLLYFQAAGDEPDLTTGPVIAWLDRVLLVSRSHRLAGRESVSAEELACEQVCRVPPSLPPAVTDMILPPATPSGRPIPRTVPVHSFHEIVSLVARGRVVHPTGAGILPARRDDIVQVPIRGLPPIPLGLTWCTAHENARIRALAAVAAAIAPDPSRQEAIPSRGRPLPRSPGRKGRLEVDNGRRPSRQCPRPGSRGGSARTPIDAAAASDVAGFAVDRLVRRGR